MYELIDAPAAPAAGRAAQSADGAGKPEWTWATVAGSRESRVAMGRRVVLELAPGVELDSVVDGLALRPARELRPDLRILEADDSEAAIAAAMALSSRPGVVHSYPVMRRGQRQLTGFSPAPGDARFRDQWHLDHRGSDGNIIGPGLNVRAAWPVSAGKGVLVAIGDNGIQLDHPDLAVALEGGPHYNFYKETADGGPAFRDADHATLVAGLVAAERDGQRGVVGVAPEARLASWVIFGDSGFGGEPLIASDEQLMDMFQYAIDEAHVQNHSWGNVSTTPLPLDPLASTGLSNAVARGRGGLGQVIVAAGGNERDILNNANDDGFTNDPRVIAVAAVRKDGRVCSYSNPGANILVSAPSGDLIDEDGDGFLESPDPTAPNVITTDRTGLQGINATPGAAGDYAGFNGTSASAPEIAGVAALILSANPALGYRDVQQILVHSARHFDLADPDLRPNGAGFLFSHNQGYGVPDAGVAVALARRWRNRPAMEQVNVVESTLSVAIPDDGLRVVAAGEGLPGELASIRSLPSMGVHPDGGTDAFPIVYVGQANEDITEDLTGKAALIQRGTSLFSEKIQRAAAAGAEFAVIFNNIGTTEIQEMGGTAFVPIPAVSISRQAGEQLRDFVAENPAATMRLRLNSAVVRFQVADTLVCEHVGLRLKTTHTRRSDVRVTLVSPSGTRSVLQAINDDVLGGPRDWTYWSAQHFGESSAGEWRLEVSDERNSTVRGPGGVFVPATGAITYAELIVRGVRIEDEDRDGLDDGWEREHFGNLDRGPTDDMDGDGLTAAREFALGSNPAEPDPLFRVDLARFDEGAWRLSWPSRIGATYVVDASPGLGAAWLPVSTNTAPGLLEERVVSGMDEPVRLFRIRDGE